jgi:hypothetical protein
LSNVIVSVRRSLCKRSSVGQGFDAASLISVSWLKNLEPNLD